MKQEAVGCTMCPQMMRTQGPVVNHRALRHACAVLGPISFTLRAQQENGKRAHHSACQCPIPAATLQ